MIEPRDARPEDVRQILTLVRELAEYERALHEVRATEEDLHRALFSDRPAAFSHVVDAAAEDGGGLAGFSMWFLNYSTWLGVHGVYLEDLFVRPQFRGRGHGRALMRKLAKVCVERGYGRFEWAVLEWNQPALDFYRALGAKEQSDWRVHRLTGEELRRLGSET